MNLREFLDYREWCPLCESSLTTLFHSSRKQNTKYEDGCLSVQFILDGRGRHQKDYKVAYLFDLRKSSFRVEFYDSSGSTCYYLGVLPFLRDRFLTLHANLEKTGFKFLRECKSCRQYRYGSNHFEMELKTATIEPLIVVTEAVALAQKLPDEQYRIFRLYNNVRTNESELLFWKGVSNQDSLSIPINTDITTCLNLPLIPFVSKEETTKRLSNLIIFT